MADDDASIPLTALANRRETGAAMALLVKGFKIGWRARQSEIDRLIRERDEARDLAFRAAFAPSGHGVSGVEGYLEYTCCGERQAGQIAQEQADALLAGHGCPLPEEVQP